MTRELAFTFDCQGAALPAILHEGDEGAVRGVLVVVGGPQYRVGSHRQFLLLARSLAAAGVPVLRFDYRGMGDAEGEFVGFEAIDADLAAAIENFFSRCPGLREVVIWGLCDAASAALFYAHRDPRIKGLVLLNPWVRTQQGQARAYVKHYYLHRLFNPELWRKIRRGKFDVRGSVRSLAANLKAAWNREGGDPAVGKTLPERMAWGLERFPGPVLLILSGDDLTAAEFRDLTHTTPHWQQLLADPRVLRRELAGANHTFSRRAWRDQVAEWTLQWLKAI